VTPLRRLALAVAVLLVFVSPALGHVPEFASDNASPSTALEVASHAKSWSIYDRVQRGQAKYYAFDLQRGDRLRVGAFTPAHDEFTPSLVVLTPTKTETASRNLTAATGANVTVPAGYRAGVHFGTRPDSPEYEPFTPAAYYHTVSVDRRVDQSGRYLVAVYGSDGAAGKVGVSVGYEESFTLGEYLRVPVDVLGIYTWEGDSPLLVGGPALTVVLGGLVAIRRFDGRDLGVVRTALAVSGFCMLGSAATVGLQMGFALRLVGPRPGALVTAIFVAVPAMAGRWLVATARDDSFSLTQRTRLGIAVAALVALATWGGFLVGPLLALTVAALPGGLLTGNLSGT
jgi:hypothetical protein